MNILRRGESAAEENSKENAAEALTRRRVEVIYERETVTLLRRGETGQAKVTAEQAEPVEMELPATEIESDKKTGL